VLSSVLDMISAHWDCSRPNQITHGTGPDCLPQVLHSDVVALVAAWFHRFA
jgi:hypothetical protein